MKKIFGLLIIALTLSITGGAQKTSPADQRLVLANEELKAALISNMNLSTEAASKIVVIENEFHGRLSAIAALGNIATKEKEVKLNEAHVSRRASLLEVSLTPRQMEDVVELSGQTRRKHKL